jgi:tetratricopeptide (TPR) repeat protein
VNGRTYLDFDLLIERAGDGYRARVLDSPAGQAAVAFAPPFDPLEVENLVLRLGRARGRGPTRDGGIGGSSERHAVERFGGALFGTVFAGEVLAALRSSLDRAGARGAGLRLRLRLTDVPELAELPWEYLFNPSLNRFLSLSDRTPLVRYLDLPEGVKPLAVTPPLRVLVMVASPSDHATLDVAQEHAKLRDALADLEAGGQVVLTVLERATLGALRQALRRGTFHVFHFVGHGGFDPFGEDGVLVFEDDSGRGRPVAGGDLGVVLHNHASLRLAILNACEGARTSQRDPFAGTAQALVQQGIPAVIAMQFEITDAAAITFAHEFYLAVADGFPVDAALSQARQALFVQGDGVEWGTPVLYMRSPDGQVFDVEPLQQAVTQQRHERLAERYAEGVVFDQAERWERSIEAYQEVVSLQGDYLDAASRLDAARRQQRLAGLYAEGMARFRARAWAEAVEQLATILALDRNYRDTASRLEEARRQLRVAERYDEAQQLHRGGRWQAVLDVAREIEALDAAFGDPGGLFESARAELATLARERRGAAEEARRGAGAAASPAPTEAAAPLAGRSMTLAYLYLGWLEFLLLGIRTRSPTWFGWGVVYLVAPIWLMRYLVGEATYEEHMVAGFWGEPVWIPGGYDGDLLLTVLLVWIAFYVSPIVHLRRMRGRAGARAGDAATGRSAS